MVGIETLGETGLAALIPFLFGTISSRIITSRGTHITDSQHLVSILRLSGNTQIFPRSKVLSHWSGYQPPANGQGHRFTSACSTDFYRGTLFGAQFDNNTFTCEPVHNLVHRRITKRNGVQFSSSRPTHESDKEFLASSDSWFRPTTVKTGPDGALWITDMYRLVIEHPEWIDDQEEKRLFLRSGHDRGRIYRVTPVSRSVPPLPTLPSNFMHQRNGMYSQELSDRLLQMLSSENGWSQETGPTVFGTDRDTDRRY